MTTPAITLEVLPAAFGDCLLVSCPSGRGNWRMLVDTGPDETYPALRARLLKLPKRADGRRHIDLFVVTHIDHDHIGAAGLLLDDSDLNLSFGDVWFNGPPRRTRGVAEGEGLARLLGAATRRLPWNVAWSGRAVCTPADSGGVELRGGGAPTITVLSPTPRRLESLYSVWTRELIRLRAREPVPVPKALRAARVPLTIEQLAARRTPVDAAIPNGSSIALLVEHRGASALLAADAFPTVLAPALRALADRRGVRGPISVDAIKLSHHGSRGNVTRQLLELVAAKHYIVSTNNAYFNHPSDETIARIIVRREGATIWFNYGTPKNRRWDDPFLTAKYGYTVRYPTRIGSGVTVRLPSR